MLAYRNPAERLFNKLDNDRAQLILAKQSDALKLIENDLGGFFNYAVRPEVSELLSKKGIYLSPNPFVSHSHPACKMIENHILFVVLPSIIKGLVGNLGANFAFEVISCKLNKVLNIRKFVNNGLINISNLNEGLVCKDIIRYGLSKKRKNLTQESRIESIAEKIFKKKTKSCFLHDEIHYWKKKDLSTFLIKSDVDDFFCSIVVPPEILTGHRQSLNPYVYKFEILHKSGSRSEDKNLRYWEDIDKGTIAFYPDGCASEAYYQDLDCLEWLGLNEFICSNGEAYGVSMHYSCFAHHIMHFSKRTKSLERIRAFDGFSHIDASSFFRDYIGSRPRVIRLSFLRSVISYILCLKKPDMESAFAKMRQLADDEREIEEFLIIGDIYKLIESRLKKIHLKDRSSIKNKITEGVGDLLERYLGEGNIISEIFFDSRSFRNVLDEIKSESFRIRCFSGYSNDSVVDIKTFYLGDDDNDCIWASNSLSENALDHNLLSQPYFIFKSITEGIVIDREIKGYSERTFIRNDLLSNCINYKNMPIEQEGSLFAQLEMAYKRWKKKKVNNFFVKFNGVTSRKRINRQRNSRIEMIVHLVSSAYTNERCISDKAQIWTNSIDLIDTESSSQLNRSRGCSEDEDVNIDCDDFGNVYCEVNDFLNKSQLDIPSESPIDTPQALNNNSENSNYADLDDCQIFGHPEVKEIFEDYENSCVFICLRDFLGCTESYIKKEIERSSIKLNLKLEIDAGLTIEEIFELMQLFNLNVTMKTKDGLVSKIFDDKFREIGLEVMDGHCTLLSVNTLTSIHLSSSPNDKRSVGQNVIDISKIVDVFAFSRALKLNEQSRLGRFGVKGNGTSSNYGGFLSQSTVNRFKKMKESEIQATMTRNLSQTSLEITMGFAGSGKSFGIEKFLEKRATGKFLVVSPRVALKKSWEDKLGPQIKRGRVKVVTFENALQMNLSSFDQIFLDEFTLYPPGYLSLLTILFHEGKDLNSTKQLLIILLFDPLQPSFFSDEFTMEERPDHLSLLKDQTVDYLAYTRRLEKQLSQLFFSSIKSLNEKRTLPNCREVFKSMQLIKTLPDYNCILCASRADKVFFSSYGKTLTFGEAQGLTFNRVLIIISCDALQVSPQHSIVALTRAREKCDFLLYGVTDIQVSMSTKNFFFSPICGNPISRGQLKNLFPSGCEVNFLETIGHRGLKEMEEKMEGDLFLKAEMNLIEPLNWFDEELKEIDLIEPKEKTHLTRIDGQYHVAVITEGIKERFSREIIDYPYHSEQFSDYRKLSESGPIGESYRSEAIYPRHQNSDSVTFWAAVKKRLVFSDPRKEKEKFIRNKSLGLTIFNLFKDTFKLDRNMDKNLFDEALAEFNDKKTSKPAGMIATHSNRSDIDWRVDDIFLFMKSQLCTKMEKRFCDGKAGQTLACFSHKVLVRFSPYCRYIEKVFSKQLDDRFYIHQRKDFNQLNEWVVKQGFDGLCTESDYEAFDRSQDSIVMAFEYHLLNYYGWPDELIEDYIWLKCNLGCKLGNFAIMRFTGEFCTFLFNTFCNMAFTAMRYHIDGASICFAGDDMCANKPLKKRFDYEAILKRLTLKAKVQVVGNPTFCGWRLTKHGIFKQPNLVLDRLNIAKEKGNLKACIDGYSLEISYAYDLGDRLFDILKEDELLAHYGCVRLIIENKRLLSSSIAELFEERVGSRIGCQSSVMTRSKPRSAKENHQLHVSRNGIYMRKGDSTAKASLKHGDLKPISISKVVISSMDAMSVHSSCLTKKRSITSKNKEVNSSMCILALSLSVSQAFSGKILEYMANLFCLIQGGKIKTKLALPEWSLILKTEEPRLSLYLISQCQYLTAILKAPSSYRLNYMASICMKEALQFHLTSGCSTVSPMIASQTLKNKLRSAVFIKALRIPKSWNLMRSQILLIYLPVDCIRQLRHVLRESQLRRERAGSDYAPERLESVKSRAQERLFKGAVQPCFLLGRKLLILINQEGAFHLRAAPAILGGLLICTKRMATLSSKMRVRFSDTVKGRVMQTRRAFLLNCLYNDQVRNTRTDHMPDVNGFAGWSDDQTRIVNDVFEHFLRHVFGAYAAYGFSPLTSYPEENISIPVLVIRIGNVDVNMFGGVEPYNLQGVALKIKGAIGSSTHVTVRASTWRNMGESVAPEIYEYGKAHPNYGDFWGATKNALMVSPAPYMGTDVIEGIMLFLGSRATMDEKRVATRFQHWLTVSMNMRTRNIADSDTTLGN